MAWSYKIKLGISYGLIALWVLICDSDLATSSTLMMHAYGTVVYQWVTMVGSRWSQTQRSHLFQLLEY